MAEDKVDYIFNRPGKLSPKEFQGIQVETPAFERAGKGHALDKLQEDMHNPNKAGGAYSKNLDPINYASQKKGIPTAQMTPSDINPASKSEN